jgi:hypothetical protein
MFRYLPNDYVYDPADLLDALALRLDNFETANPEAETGDWTLAVQDALQAISKQASNSIEHLCARTTAGPGTGEFMLDAVWWRRTTPNSIEQIALAVESEFAGWARNRGDVAVEVAKDFEKLLVIKSPLKLMIFCSWYSKTDTNLEPMRAAVWSKLKKYIAQYSHHIEGEKYLFFDTAVLGQRRAWIFTVPRSGSIALEDIIEEHVLS